MNSRATGRRSKALKRTVRGEASARGYSVVTTRKELGAKANDTAEAAIGLRQDPRRANEEYGLVKPVIDIIPSLA